MADFVIRPAGDPDWGNARFLSGALPLTAVDAASLGIVMGADYEIGRVGSLTTFQVTQTGTAPPSSAPNPASSLCGTPHDHARRACGDAE
jgi:hypothetical protein